MTTIDFKAIKASPTVSKICMIVSAISMGHVGIIISFLDKFNVLTIVLIRGLFGTLFLTLFLLKSNSLKWDFLKESLKIHWKELLIIGFMNPLIILFYFINIILTGYSFAAFLLYTGPMFFLLFLILSREEKVSKVNVLNFLLAVVGVAIIMEFWNGNALLSGTFSGILSGLTLGILIYYKKKIYITRKNLENIFKSQGDFDTFLAWWPNLFIIFMFLPLSIYDLMLFSFFDLIIALILGLFPTALAFLLYNIGIKNDKGGNIVILSYIEPVTATILNIIVLKSLSIFTIIGGSLILVANLFVLKYSS
ncbi:MAG: DMT family transporter [Candidatus Odinarchaeota archaeon]